MPNYILLENGGRIDKENSSGLLLLENQGGGGGGEFDQSGTTSTYVGQPTLGSGGATVGY